MYAICAEQVTKQYRNGINVLSGLSLTVEAGEIFSLLGPNGAGKSTLIRILTTCLRPDSGKITMLGKDLGREARALRRQIACAFQQPSIDRSLTLEENMLFQGRLHRIPADEAKRRMEQLVSVFGLAPCRKYPVASYSGGTMRRLDIAANLMSNPKILFLDEPTVGVDVKARRIMWETIRQIREEWGTTIFLTTHYLEEADELSDTVCIMNGGKAVVQGSPENLRSLLEQELGRGNIAGRPRQEQAVQTFQAKPALEDVFLWLTGKEN